MLSKFIDLFVYRISTVAKPLTENLKMSIFVNVLFLPIFSFSKTTISVYNFTDTINKLLILDEILFFIFICVIAVLFLFIKKQHWLHNNFYSFL